jgi:hypothetical protein
MPKKSTKIPVIKKRPLAADGSNAKYGSDHKILTNQPAPPNTQPRKWGGFVPNSVQTPQSNQASK